MSLFPCSNMVHTNVDIVSVFGRTFCSVRKVAAACILPAPFKGFFFFFFFKFCLNIDCAVFNVKPLQSIEYCKFQPDIVSTLV